MKLFAKRICGMLCAALLVSSAMVGCQSKDDTLYYRYDYDLRNIRSLAANARDTDVMGVLLTTWHHLPAYLPKLFFAAEYLWQNKPVSDQITERACLLRRLYDAAGDYHRAGWNAFEVEG